MKSTYIKKLTTIILICFGVASLVTVNGCVESKHIAEKNGMKLWSQNCQRCHFSPSSNGFSNEEWKTVSLHMQTRALLTNKEIDKVIEFLQN